MFETGTLKKSLQIVGDGLLLFGRDDGKISLQEKPLWITFRVSRYHMRVHMGNMLACLDAVILKYICASRAESPIRRAGQVPGEVRDRCELRVSCLKNRFHVPPGYDERRSAFADDSRTRPLVRFLTTDGRIAMCWPCRIVQDNERVLALFVAAGSRYDVFIHRGGLPHITLVRGNRSHQSGVLHGIHHVRFCAHRWQSRGAAW